MAQLDSINELNIGHVIIADAVFVGLEQAVIMMKNTTYKDFQKDI